MTELETEMQKTQEIAPAISKAKAKIIHCLTPTTHEPPSPPATHSPLTPPSREPHSPVFQNCTYHSFQTTQKHQVLLRISEQQKDTGQIRTQKNP